MIKKIARNYYNTINELTAPIIQAAINSIKQHLIVVSNFKIYYRHETLYIKVLVKNPIIEKILYVHEYSTTIMLNINFKFDIIKAKTSEIIAATLESITYKLYYYEYRTQKPEKLEPDKQYYKFINLISTPIKEIQEIIDQSIKNYIQYIHGSANYQCIYDAVLQQTMKNKNISNFFKINNKTQLLFLAIRLSINFYNDLLNEIEQFIDKEKTTITQYNNVYEIISSIDQVQQIWLKNGYVIYYKFILKNQFNPSTINILISSIYNSKQLSYHNIKYIYEIGFDPIIENNNEREIINKKLINKIKYYIAYNIEKQIDL